MNEVVSYHIPESLPKEYAHFNQLNGVPDLAHVRDTTAYDRLYEGLWTKLIMHIDINEQRRLISSLRDNLSGTSLEEEPELHADSVAGYWEQLESESKYPIFSEARRNFSVNDRRIRSLRLEVLPWIQKDIAEAGASDDMLEYTERLQRLLSARTKSLKPISQATNGVNAKYSSIADIFRMDFEHKISETLAEAEPYHLAQKGISAEISKNEQELFGQDAELAGVLWRCVTYLRSSNLPRRNYKKLSSEIRQTLTKNLIDGDYQKGRFYVEEMIARYPGIFPSFIETKLDLDIDTFRELLDEEAEQKAKEKEELHVLKRTSVFDEELGRFRETNEMNSILERIIGRELVSSDGQITITIERAFAWGHPTAGTHTKFTYRVEAVDGGYTTKGHRATKRMWQTLYELGIKPDEHMGIAS